MEKRYSIQEVFDMLGEENLAVKNARKKKEHEIEVEGYKVYARSLRYMTFYQKGTTCVCCGRKGSYFKLEGDENSTRRHFNLYCDDGTLMTKDHILPKSLGGLDVIDNMQPMCRECNEKKGNGKGTQIISVKKNGDIKEYHSIASLILSYISSSKKKTKTEQFVLDVIEKADAIRCAIQNDTEYMDRKWYIVSDSD